MLQKIVRLFFIKYLHRQNPAGNVRALRSNACTRTRLTFMHASQPTKFDRLPGALCAAAIARTVLRDMHTIIG
ncbi:hypothetical protein ACCQ05_02030 [Xanthomonas sp. NCPPB 3582]|uniref:hypothetical protein n=1 Tax=Xanthomonas sp. NCPPB 3582 TaxID=487557 RepID=UPI003555C6C9